MASWLEKFPGFSKYDYMHRISSPLIALMMMDLPRVDYEKKNSTFVTKEDEDFVKEKNSRSEVRVPRSMQEILNLPK